MKLWHSLKAHIVFLVLNAAASFSEELALKPEWNGCCMLMLTLIGAVVVDSWYNVSLRLLEVDARCQYLFESRSWFVLEFLILWSKIIYSRIIIDEL